LDRGGARDFQRVGQDEASDAVKRAGDQRQHQHKPQEPLHAPPLAPTLKPLALQRNPRHARPWTLASAAPLTRRARSGVSLNVISAHPEWTPSQPRFGYHREIWPVSPALQ